MGIRFGLAMIVNGAGGSVTLQENPTHPEVEPASPRSISPAASICRMADEAIQKSGGPAANEAERLRRLRQDARRPISVNLAEGIALSHRLMQFTRAPPCKADFSRGGAQMPAARGIDSAMPRVRVAFGVARLWPNSSLSIERPTGTSCFDGRSPVPTSSKFLVDDAGGEERRFGPADLSLDDSPNRHERGRRNAPRASALFVPVRAGSVL